MPQMDKILQHALKCYCAPKERPGVLALLSKEIGDTSLFPGWLTRACVQWARDQIRFGFDKPSKKP